MTHKHSLSPFQIVKKQEDPSSPYTSVIGDFNQDGLTVFDRSAMTHWKPVMLISAAHVRLFAYLLFYRNLDQEWVAYARGFAEQECLDRYELKLKLGSAAKDNKATEFTFSGRILAHDVSEKEVIASGNYLSLKDAHVQKLCSGKTLFEYDVEIVERKK